ncbi:glyoxalase superfamily protein [Peribacillus alkalitolerans]|uniref:glyoxalase superfamily protein n=1 Tax=Peribacillus alkalitolerans TaxID=1550385 RepID=UPI0013D52D1F|nr:glyoxalase superfamily protein [Peribacillus alkalitolerans]
MITPIFRIFDVDKAISFYCEFLGFNQDWVHQFEENMPKYIQVTFNDAIIHLSEHHGDASPGSAIRFKMANLKDYNASLLNKDYPYAKPGLQKTPWNTLEMTLTDPFSNRIIFYENI